MNRASASCRYLEVMEDAGSRPEGRRAAPTGDRQTQAFTFNTRPRPDPAMAISVEERARRARQASLLLQRATDQQRRRALEAFAAILEARRAEVVAANRGDLDAARAAVDAGTLSPPLYRRLDLQGSKLDQAIVGVRALARLPDPLGRTLRSTLLDDGLRLYQITVPIGVVACAFESRPDAAIQICALAMRSGNAVLLKGGREAAHSNQVVADLARQALDQVGLPADGVTLIADREELNALLDLDTLVDLIIPRGSSTFVRHVMDHTRIPVLGHAEGVCHTYVDRQADLDKALSVAVDAKLDYAAACNATECYLVHQDVAPAFVPRLVEALAAKGVRVHADAAARKLAPDTMAATEADWGHEYGDLACALRVVGGEDEAIGFINEHGSKHTEAILTQDKEAARRFVDGVDAAGVFVNVSTRFSDGYRYGLGAEVGISTGKIHHRGPVGLEGLTSTKWILLGDGHTAAAYQGEGARAFRHQPLKEEWHGP